METTGQIGTGQAVDGNDALRTSGLLGTPGTLTLSGWFNLQGPDTQGAELISLGDAVQLRIDDQGVVSGTGGSYQSSPGSWSNIYDSGTYAMTGWHYIAFTFDDAADEQKLFIDGVEQASQTYTASILYTGAGSDTYLGRHGNGQTDFDFTGAMDEVRVSQATRSASWIAAEYLNQSNPAAVVSVAQESSPLSYSITAGNTGGAFAIDPATGQITVAAALDRETISSYDLTVEVSDGALTDSAVVTLVIDDVNEFAPVMPDQTLAVSENATNGTTVGVVSATDADAGQSLSFQILAGNGSGAFAIDAATGRIFVADATQLDAAGSPQYTLTVQVDDDLAPTLSDTASITIDVTANSAPIIDDQTFAVDENSATSTVVGTVAAFDADASAGVWADSAWTYRKELTIDHNRVYGDLTDFPILVSFAGDGDLAAGVGDLSGLDIFFALADGTKLDHELEFFDSGTGQLTAWVRIPFLSSSADTAIYMYYGNASAPDQQNAAGVWDSGFELVHHFDNLQDSTENSHDLAAIGNAALASGTMGGVAQFDGSGDGYTLGDIDALDGIPQMTISAWVRMDTLDDFTVVASKEGGGTQGWDLGSSAVVFGKGGGSNDVGMAVGDIGDNGTLSLDSGYTTSNVLQPGAYKHWVGVFDGTSAGQRITMYIDGVPVSTTIEDSPPSVTPSTSYAVQLGLSALSRSNDLDGELDEVRISTTARTSAWIRTEYENQNDASVFITAAEEEQQLAYAITAGNIAGAFAIDSTSGEITVANPAALDHESLAQYLLTVRATDSGSPSLSDTAQVTIDIGDVNEFNPVASDATFALLENSPNGTAVGAVAASDADTSQTLSYAIAAGDPTGIFAIDPATGAITVADGTQLDHEAAAQHVLTVTVTDDGAPQLSATATITIDVQDVNEFDPAVTSSTFTVTENSANGTAVGSVVAADADTSQTLSYAITAGDPTGIFSIDPSTGAIAVADGAQLNHEASAQHVLTVTVTDDRAPQRSGTGTITVNVQDVNEFDPTVTDASLSIAENSANGTAVGSASALDADTSQALSYAITGGDPTGIFAIDFATGAITVADTSQLDHEASPQHVLTVTATDDLAPQRSGTGTITVDVQDVNEFAPAVTDATFSVLENSANGTAVGSVTASDADTSQTLSYALTGGDPTGIFTIDAATGAISVADGVQLDYESTAQHTLIVTVTDDLAPQRSATGSITVDVLDANEAAPVVPDASFALPENSANGTLVGSVTASDADTSQTLSYAISAGDPGGIFAIDPATGQVTIAGAAQLDHESATQHVLTVVVSDSGVPQLSTPATLTIDVLDVNEFDPVVTDATFSVLENSANGTGVGSVSATDADSSQTLSYAITGGDPTGIFAIDSATGALSVADSVQLDHEAAAQHVLTVTVTDDRAPQRSGSGTLTVNVQDVNEFDPAVSDAAFAVFEGSANGTAVGSVLASDADTSQTLSYAITAGDPTGIFAIDAATGAISVADGAQLDHETAGQHVLTVTAADDLAPQRSGTGTLTVDVQDVNEFDPVVQPAGWLLEEGAGSNSPVGTVSASDADTSQTLTYAITGGDPSGIFAVDAATGRVTVARSGLLDGAAGAVYRLTVTVTDDLAPTRSSSAVLMISITPSGDGGEDESTTRPAAESPEDPGPPEEEQSLPRETVEGVHVDSVERSAPSGAIRPAMTRPEPLSLSLVAPGPSLDDPASPELSQVQKLEEPLEFGPRLATPGLSQVHRDMERDADLHFAAVQFSVATMLVSAGALSWLIRSNSLVSSLMLSLPVWLRFDPLVVISSPPQGEAPDRNLEEEWQTWLESTELENVFDPDPSSKPDPRA